MGITMKVVASVLCCRRRNAVAYCGSILLLLATTCGVAAQEQQQHLTYGADVSFPMIHAPVSTNYAWLPHNVDPEHNPTPEEYKNMPVQPLGDMETKYKDYIQGCVDHYNRDGMGRGQRCISNEQERLEMTRRQVPSMRNYTQKGYTKIRAPDHVFSLLKEFWEKNKDNQDEESWGVGNIYVNHWVRQSTMVSVEDESKDGGGFALKQNIWNAARDTIEEWTGYRQTECSLYGIRVYHEGAMLAPHVDRLPLVSSAIINVAQDVDEPWPLEVIGHDGIATNVTMLPGDLVLYESHSIIHGRPFPLKGRFMANVFIHFEPMQKIGGQVEYTGDLPPYLIPGSEEESNWRAFNPDGHKITTSHRSFQTGSTDAHYYASMADTEKLRETLDQHAEMVTIRDANGWTPLHEAIRAGNSDSVRLLLDRGAEMNLRVGDQEQGGSPLYMAKQFFGNSHPIVTLLESRGAKEYDPSWGEL